MFSKKDNPLCNEQDAAPPFPAKVAGPQIQQAAATAARRRAIAGNWCAAAALDDDELDIPGYRPAQGWRPARGTGIATTIHPPARVQRMGLGA